MKIVFDPHSAPVAKPKPAGKEPGAEKNGFVDLLGRALESAAASPAPVGGGELAVSFRAGPPSPPEPEVGELAEEILEGLEKYAGRLADPSAGLRELDSLLVALQRRCEALAPLLERLPEESRPLREIAGRAVLTVQTEILHLRRGDYLGT
ncbi:MAG: hypothetical protein WHT06_05630 [Desulfobacterales bacterium]